MKPVALVLALALAAGTAISQPANQPQVRSDKAPMGGRMAIMQKLNLTDEQQTQIRKLHVDFQKKQIQNEAKIRLARLDLMQMMQADKPDRSAIEKTIRDISALQTDTKLARVDQIFAIKNVLTPEQQKMAKQLLMERRSGMRGRMQMFHRQGPGMRGDMRGDIMAPPDPDAPGMAAMEDPMDAPDQPMDFLDLGDFGAE